MLPDLPDILLDKIRTHALRHISERNQTKTNLSLEQRIYKRGDLIGPAKQNIRAEGETAVVFADDEPLANFGHPCRYLLYDAKTGEFLKEVPARFPPSIISRSRLTSFFVQTIYNRPLPYRPWPPVYRCPRRIPDGNRYAILFCGLTQARHLNDMEFCYRTLIDIYGFHAANIYVCNYDGTLNVFDSLPGVWPGDNTAYRIKVTANGTRASFQNALADIAGKIQPHDMLFIHSNNHGDNFNDGNGSFLCGFLHGGDPAPNDDGDFTYYYASEFASDIATLPACRSLVVMMEQCCSGGFNQPILNSSTAGATSVSSAAQPTTLSYPSNDGNWDTFAYEWIAAMNGAYPGGTALASNPDTNHDGVVDVQEAYNYATANDNVGDQPLFSASATGATLTLDQQYEIVWWPWIWCWILWPIFHPIFEQNWPPIVWPPVPNPPDPAPYYSLVNAVMPEIQRVLSPALNADLSSLRERLGAKIKPIVDKELARQESLR
jgi:hypothetical protein